MMQAKFTASRRENQYPPALNSEDRVNFVKLLPFFVNGPAPAVIIGIKFGRYQAK